jgi:hypothetical protein
MERQNKIFFYILRFLYFSNNRHKNDKADDNYYILQKNYLNKLNDSYAKYYSPTEHLATDEIIMLYKGRVTFKQFGVKTYKLHDSKG